MTASLSDSTLLTGLFSDPEIAAIFSDQQFVRMMLHVEAALAQAEVQLGIIPAEAGKRITEAAEKLEVNFDGLHISTESHGFPVIELVRQLRKAVGGDNASYVHWGATTQDIIDTARVLQTRSALGILENRRVTLARNLGRLADRHRHTLMAGRTHSQQALPISFGLKVAGWIAPLLRHHQRWIELSQRVNVVQFGGAVGTLASLDERGIDVQQALAANLDLSVPMMPWHTQRDGFAEVAGWLSMLTGSLAKMAQDIILLAQNEIGEVRESADSSRGGSSTMPQKSNPIQSECIIAAARMNASLLASMHQAMIVEQERGTHGWQMELATLPQMFALTASALNRAILLSENLVVDEDRMRENVASSNGLMLGEAITFALAPFMSRADAKALVTESVQTAVREGRHLVDVVSERTDAPVDWDSVRDESRYFGSADAFVDRVLKAIEID
jgi:3-carboxy-cis,cis-muconate cycloisomerase